MFKCNPKEFLRRFITVDETWIHHYTPGNKGQSKQWVKAGGNAPKQPKIQLASKVMGTVFGMCMGYFILIIWRKEKPLLYNITANYWIDPMLLSTHLTRKKNLFHRDNAPTHKAVKTMTKLTSPTSVFSRFGPPRLLSVPKLEEVVNWQEILLKRKGNC